MTSLRALGPISFAPHASAKLSLNTNRKEIGKMQENNSRLEEINAWSLKDAWGRVSLGWKSSVLIKYYGFVKSNQLLGLLCLLHCFKNTLFDRMSIKLWVEYNTSFLFARVIQRRMYTFLYEIKMKCILTVCLKLRYT